MKKHRRNFKLFLIMPCLVIGHYAFAQRQADAHLQGQGSSSVLVTNSPSDLMRAYRQGLISKEELMRMGWAYENAKPLDFYGEVVDQYGNPIAGAKVRGGVLLIEGMTHSGGKDYYTETDAQGKFSFVGIHGAGLGVIPSKPGYEYQGKYGRSEDYRPDPNNPVVLTMWKLKGPEPMLHTKIQAGVACNGTPRNFDVLTGRRDTGDMVVSLSRNPVDVSLGSRFDWTLTLGTPRGGFVEIADIYPNEAPTSGYQSSVTISMPQTATNWTPSLARSYYFRLRDGEAYGRMTIHIQADYPRPPTLFEVEAFVNPTPSRNLEYVREKEIQVFQAPQRQVNQ